MTGLASTLVVLQLHVGGCREWLADDRCGAPAEYVLWGKLIPPEGLGPRCYEHALRHVDYHALRSRSDYALINLRDLAEDLSRAGAAVDQPSSHGVSS